MLNCFLRYPLQIAGKTSINRDSDDFRKFIRMVCTDGCFKARIGGARGFYQ